MNPDQRARARREFFGYLHHDWVELEVAIQCANEAVGFDDLRIVTPESREFASLLVEEEALAVGALDDAGRFVAWSGSREVLKKRVLDLMPLGERPDFQVVWFDRVKREPNQPSQPTPSGRG